MTSDDGTKALQVQQPPNFLLPTPYSGSLISISSKLNKPWHRFVLNKINRIINTNIAKHFVRIKVLDIGEYYNNNTHFKIN